jgi:uncharacterized protein involved in exopolysaccharide biosynthesis
VESNVNNDSSEGVVRAILVRDSADQVSAFDVAAIFGFIRKNWLWIFAFALVGAVASVAYTFLLPRTYRAEVLLVPAKGTGESSGGLGGMVGRYSSLASAIGISIPGDSSTVQVAMARLQSRRFIESFIVEQKIMPVLFPEDPVVPPPKAQQDAKAHTLQDGYRKFVRSILLVKHDKSNDLVTLRVDWVDRELAAQWANQLVARINADMRQDAIQETDHSLEYLRTELAKADFVSLKDSISSLMEAQINKRMLALTQLDYAFRVLDPAQVPDWNKKVAPRRSIYMVFGFALGSFVGALVALRRQARRVQA